MCVRAGDPATSPGPCAEPSPCPCPSPTAVEAITASSQAGVLLRDGSSTVRAKGRTCRKRRGKRGDENRSDEGERGQVRAMNDDVRGCYVR